MLCQTVKEGFECVFMTKKGCSFNGGSCHPIVEKCEGCERCVEYSSVKYCIMYPDPAGKWAMGGCPSATHIEKTAADAAQKINPLKASKRGSRR
ncbi:MAG: PxxKW family cysteine-rich protein [Deltaproteobacteria bacterium]|nr:PxxKW family cysteine-rich protein [Deltaproteobacteria bacterium]